MDTKKVTLPSGKEMEYKNYCTASLYLDLQDIPEHLAGTRIRKVAASLITQIGGKIKPNEISKEIEELSLQDLDAASKIIIKVIEGAMSVDEKKN